MKLEIKHLSPYLPYSLKVKLPPIPESGIKEHVMVAEAELSNNWVTISGILRNSNYKPILRPLSDLIIKIEHNNANFIPLEELVKQYCLTRRGRDGESYGLYRFSNLRIEENANGFQCLWSEPMTDKITQEKSFTYDPFLRRFLTRIESERAPIGVGYQLDMFNKLFEWHFDVLNLIPEKLALNINTLQ